MKKIKRIIFWGITYLTSRIFNIFMKMEDNKILFMSDVRCVLGGNLKSVYDELSKDKSLKLVLEFKEDRRVKRGFRGFIKLMKNIATSKYILLDDYSRTINLIKVRKGQEVVQLWHGPGAFKKFGYSRPGHEKYKKLLVAGHKNYTKAIVTANNIRWCYAEGFGMPEDNIKATGFPRTDLLFDTEYTTKVKEEIYESYPEFKNKKIIMFAPTYRGESTKIAYYDWEKLDLDKIYNELKDDYIFIIKWHPAVYNNIKIGKYEGYDLEKYNGFFVDLSENRDINDLLLVTDVLITDYSSVIFDYALLNKPIVYYTYDLEEYENGRGLYYDFKDYVYGDVAKNCDELVKCIKNENMAEELRSKFIKEFMEACDGNSTKKTCNWIFEPHYPAKLSTSILTVEEEDSKNTFNKLSEAKTDYFHIDVMDGKFVKANTEVKMEKYVTEITNNTKVPLDVHLMVNNVKKYINQYIKFNPEYITFHIEAVKNKTKIYELIKLIKDNNIKVGLSIKPTTSVQEIYEFIPYIDMVLVMSVEPGKGGQKFMPESIDKIKKIKKYAKKHNSDLSIQVDGGINENTAKLAIKAGTNILVAGNAIISSDDYSKAIEKIKSSK